MPVTSTFALASENKTPIFEKKIIVVGTLRPGYSEKLL